MNPKRLAVLLAASTIVFASGCMPIPTPTSNAVALFDANNNGRAEVAIGGVVTVVLTDNSASTGCTWQYVPANDGVLELLISGVQQEQGSGVGASGQAVFVLSAKTVGVTSLRIEKTCPDNTKTAYTVQVTVMPGGF
jgi:predicted secreted protein